MVLFYIWYTLACLLSFGLSITSRITEDTAFIAFIVATGAYVIIEVLLEEIKKKG